VYQFQVTERYYEGEKADISSIFY